MARVEHGETLEITSRGKPIARIVPVTEGELDDLVAMGKVIPPTIHSPFPMPTSPPDGKSASDVLIAMREEERW